MVLCRNAGGMAIHELHSLEAHEKQAIEELLAEEKETHRTFNHLIGELEDLERVTKSMEKADAPRERHRLAQEGRALAHRLTISLNHLQREEQEVRAETREVRGRVVTALSSAIRAFERAGHDAGHE